MGARHFADESLMLRDTFLVEGTAVNFFFYYDIL